MKTTIILADDHELVRKSIAALLRDETDFEVVAECSNGRELLELVATLKPAVAIVDVAMPELNGVEATRRIRELSPATRIIVLSNYADATYVRETLKAGAVGYIVKSGAANDLIQAVRTGTRSHVYLSDAVSVIATGTRKSDGQTGAGSGTRPLSTREREVLQLIAEGRTSKEVASLLGISATTVKSHRNHIMEKLDIHDKAGLTRYAIRIGLIRIE
ncbi:MAG: response regulator transcription factor [Pyrinomonadaceae bacterium]|nr:response regulator transcription factor [Pyrinomonadaceae bacterium]